jgi:hypothetical protein
VANAWLKMIGSSDWGVPQHPWRDIDGLDERTRFPRDQFPGGVIGRGDLLVLYAVGGWKSIFGIVEVDGEPERDVPGDGPEVARRWPHAVKVIRTPDYIEDLANAPSLFVISRRLADEIHQGVSHIRMTVAELDVARAAIRRARVTEGRP